MKKAIVFLLLVSAASAEDSKPIRIFLTDHESWQQASSLVATTTTGASHAEQIKTLNKGCPALVITGDPAKADYILAWDSKTWQQTSWSGHENEYTLYNSEKDLVASGATHHMGNAAKEICKLVEKAQNKTTASAPPSPSK